MDIRSDYQISFKAVSINPKLRPSKTTQIINWGMEKFGKLKAENKYDTFESLNKAHDDLTKQMNEKRDKINDKLWFYPKSIPIKSIDRTEAKQKEALDKRREELLQKEAERVKQMGTLVDKVGEETSNIEKQVANDTKRMRTNNDMELFRAKYVHPTEGFGSIAGYDSEKSILRKYFISEINKEKEGKKANVPGSVLFFGPTGNGKSTFAKAFAQETGCTLVPIRMSLRGVDRYNMCMKTLKKKAKEAETRFRQNNTRTILYVDEIGKMTDKTSTVTKEMGEFLNTCSEKYHCTVFGATNYPLDIQLPLTGKNSVFPYKISLDPPDKDNKTKILRHYLRDRLPQDTDYGKMAEHMDEIENKTGRKFNIAQISETVGVNGYTKELKPEEVYEAIDKSKPAIDEQSLKKYEQEVSTLIDHEVKE